MDTATAGDRVPQQEMGPYRSDPRRKASPLRRQPLGSDEGGYFQNWLREPWRRADLLLERSGNQREPLLQSHKGQPVRFRRLHQSRGKLFQLYPQGSSIPFFWLFSSPMTSFSSNSPSPLTTGARLNKRIPFRLGKVMFL